MRKSERHRVKRDELVTVFERIHVYIEENLRRVALMAAIGIGLLLAILGVWSWLDGREQSASFLLARMMEAYRAPLAFSQEAQQAEPGSTTYASGAERDQKVIELADDLLARFGSTRAAPRALYYKALALEREAKH